MNDMLTNEKNMLIIINPRSGKMRMRSALLQVIEIFSSAGYNVTVYPTKAPRDAIDKVKNCAGQFSLIVCCGGDGTLNEVITGVMESSVRTPLGYIPSGTLNEWSTGLKISKNFETAAKDIINGSLTSMDIGQFGDKYFSYTASFGAFTEASYSAPQDVKNLLGELAYLFEGMKSLGNIRPIELSFDIDGKTVSGSFLFGAISNSLSVGGIVKYNKSTVTLNDGLFEIMLIRTPENLSQLQGLVSAVLNQNYDNPHIEFYHVSSITVHGAEEIAWTLDGEKAISPDTFKINNLHNAIDFYLPQ